MAEHISFDGGGIIAHLRLSAMARLRPHLAFIALLLILFLTFLDNTIISAVLANVQADLHSGVSDLQWIVGGYALAFASLMLMCGSIGDNYGRKKMMLIGVAIFCGGSVVCAMASSSTMLVIGRIVMGVGAAASEPGTLSMLRHIYPEPRKRARALGAWAAVSGLALAMGPVIGAVLVGIWNWRAIFWFNLVFGGAALLLAVVVLPAGAEPTRHRLDYLGFVLGAFAIGATTYATIGGETAGYLSSGIITLYVVSGLAIVAFVWVELRTHYPMFNLNFFRHPPFAGSTFIALTTYFAILSIFFFVALYLEIVANASAYQLALDFLPLLVGMVAASIMTGRWVATVGSRVPMMMGCLAAAMGVLLTDVAIAPSAGPFTVGLTMGLAGIGFGIIIVPMTSVALTSLPAENSGMAASMTNTSREIGAVAGVAILGSIVNGQLTVQLTKRLVAIGIPEAYRAQIITAVTTGQISAQEKSLQGKTSDAVQQIIKKVIAAAYDAFQRGLHLALTISFFLLAISAAVAYFTGTREST